MFTSFDILTPALIPTPKYVHATLPANVLREITQSVRKVLWISNVDAAAAFLVLLEKLRQDLPNDGCQSVSQNGGPQGTKPSRDDNAHDEYFGIRRVSGAVHHIFLQPSSEPT